MNPSSGTGRKGISDIPPTLEISPKQEISYPLSPEAREGEGAGGEGQAATKIPKAANPFAQF
jgi:hypothetical protein